MWTRRRFLSSFAALPLVALAAPEKGRHKISDVRTMTLKGPSRTYVLLKVIADDGTYGIAEAYGTPAIGVKEQILSLRPWLTGKDPLEIDTLFTTLGERTPDLSGTRTDGSAHELLRAASGIEMALWDLAGKILGVPSSTLLGGRFRKRVRVYDHAAPRNMLDKASCRDWAAKVKADPAGFTAHKFGFPHSSDSRVLSSRDLISIRQAFENCREAIGYEHDIMVHCHWEYDLRTSIQIAEAVESIKPMWLEDPLQVEYSEAWTALRAASKVPICTGENLARRQGFKDFIVHLGCDILHPDLRNSGGFLETKRVADMAAIYGLPMSTHNTGSQLHTWATCQWASSIRDFLAVETITGQGGWMDQLLKLDGPYIREGYVAVTDRPGLGVDVNEDIARAHLAPGETWWG